MDYLSKLESVIAEKLEALAPVTDKRGQLSLTRDRRAGPRRSAGPDEQ
jgi:hypothetical protein